MPYLPRPKKAPRFRTRRKSSNRPEDKRFYDSKRWKLTRQLQLQSIPYCEACAADGETRPLVHGAHIDHIVRRKDGGADLDERNLQTLCRAHHEVKNRMERWYGCLVEYEGEEGERVPVEGEKQRLLKKLIG